MKIPAGIVIVALALALTGCARPSIHRSNVIAIEAEEYNRVFDATVLVLREYGFTVDRHDFRHGVVTTIPVSSPTVLEPWSNQNRTTAQALGNTLTHQRRILTVSLTAMETDQAEVDEGDEGDFELRVEAQIERRQVPRRHMTRSAAGHRILGTLHTTPAELADRGITHDYWAAVGRDAPLEQHILATVIRRSLTINESADE